MRKTILDTACEPENSCDKKDDWGILLILPVGYPFANAGCKNRTTIKIPCELPIPNTYNT
jgi:hypothetical protein